MATTLIRNGFLGGALAGMGAAAKQFSIDPTDYATIVNAADAFATEALTENAALVAPMADADSAYIGEVCRAAAFSATFGAFRTSATAADYLASAKQAAAMAKQAVAKLV